MFFIKKVILSISAPLKHIFNLSFNSGSIPNQLKIAKVIPIYKSGDKTSSDNYRPISLLSCFSKIMEKIVYIRLSNFLERCDILSKFQFGFRPNHSTIHPMTKLLNFVSKALNEKKHALALFCDLRKAFDSCNHEILLKKLEKIGIRNNELLWFKNYLTNRKQFVFLNGHASSLIEILLGVPQGSILGPILFLLYINDLPVCSELTSLLFADDTTLLACSDNIEELYNFVNHEFRKVVEFFRINKIALHPNKTKYMLFSNSNTAINFNAQLYCNFNNENTHDPNPSLIIPITRVKSSDEISAIRFLGVHFDPNLNFKFHISTIQSKLSKALYALRMTKNFLSKRALTSIYYALFHSHLNYAIEIWSCTSQSHLQCLFKMQKSAVRLITNSRYNAHSEPLFKSLEILPLSDLAIFFKLKYMQSYYQKTIPALLRNTWQLNSERFIGEMIYNFAMPLTLIYL